MWTGKRFDTDTLEKEKIFHAFPISLRPDVEKVMEVLPFKKSSIVRWANS
jgi:hypothetical protein